MHILSRTVQVHNAAQLHTGPFKSVRQIDTSNKLINKVINKLMSGKLIKLN